VFRACWQWRLSPLEETYTLKTIIPVPGGLTSFDIAFVDANINTFVLADRTNKSIDVVNTATNTMTHQYNGVIRGHRRESGKRVGPERRDHRPTSGNSGATDGPVLSNCTPSPTGLRCTGPVTTPVRSRSSI